MKPRAKPRTIHRTKRGLNWLCVALLWSWSLPGLGQIMYVTPGPNDANNLPTTAIRIVNPDGTNLQTLSLPGVPAPQTPSVSPDGRFIAFTSRNPLRPLEQSQSVIQLDRVTGNLTRIIGFRDAVDSNGEEFRFNPFVKAYSPNNRFMVTAVKGFVAPARGRPATVELSTVEIYDLATVNSGATALLNSIVYSAPPADGIHTAAVGVDWSPSGQRVAVPRAMGGPNGVQDITPIFLIDPATGAATQLTRPQERFLQRDIGNIVTYEEHDYAPAFSPSGVGLAYLRVAQVFSVQSDPSTQPEVQASVRITRVDGTNDRAVFTFNPGLIPNTVNWSPDGTRLVLDFGPRASLFGLPLLQPDPARLAVYTMNIDGSNLTRIANAPAAQPVWLPVANNGGGGNNGGGNNGGGNGGNNGGGSSSASAPAAALLPSSRSAQQNNPVTVFATLVNTAGESLTDCGIALADSLPLNLSFQTTDPATNALTGTVNERVDIPANASQSFLVTLTPTATFEPTSVAFEFDCANTDPATSINRVNTLLLSSAAQAVADIIALAATASGDGILNLSPIDGSGAFAVASVNVGSGAQVEVSADTADTPLGLQLSVCQTNPATGQCLAPPAGLVTLQADANATPTFSIFADANSNIAFDAANNRVRVVFRSNGVIRGETSVAVRTQE